jgi:hypothetical protein
MKLNVSSSSLLALAVAIATAGTASAQCIDQAPLTVYEAAEMSPQNMDYDKANNMFIAHAGWYNDKEIAYYKFRIFSPGTYAGLIAPGSTAADVPTQKIYFPTTDGTLAGSVGNPIIEYHTADGNSYSDFMEVVFVAVDGMYVANDFTSEEAILASGATLTESGIILNIPVVPTGSSLEHPHQKGSMAPIVPTTVFYKCQEVQTFVFEVTDDLAAKHFADTRVEDPSDFAFAIPVVDFASKAYGVRAIPLKHVNQYSHGVVEGVNGGGPSPAGQRNIINLDRGDIGYSPLWSIDWVTELPVNYNADKATSFVDMQEAKGYNFVQTPMFVNCPDIGNVGEATPEKTNGPKPYIDIDEDSNWILGSHMTLIFKADKPISFQVDGMEIASTTTNMMGAYEYELMTADIPEGAAAVSVVSDGTEIRSISVQSSIGMPGDEMDDTSAAVGSFPAGAVGALGMVSAFAALTF